MTSQLYCTIAGQKQSMQQQQVQQEQVQEHEQAASGGAAGPAPHTGCVNSKETAQRLSGMLLAVLLYLPAHLPVNHKADWLRDWAVHVFKGCVGLPAPLQAASKL